MSRILSLTLLLTLAGGAGCATTHLGPDTGVATRGAFAAQKASDPDRAPGFTAEDARGTLAARRGDKGKSGDASAASVGLASVPLMIGAGLGGGGTSSGGAGWQGSQSPISLEAK